MWWILLLSINIYDKGNDFYIFGGNSGRCPQGASLSSLRAMLWVHSRTSGGKREICKEELHVGSSFACICATSHPPQTGMLLQSMLSPSSPTLLSFFFSTLLTSLSFSRPQGMDKKLHYLLHVPSLLFETWKLSPSCSSWSLLKSVWVPAIRSSP